MRFPTGSTCSKPDPGANILNLFSSLRLGLNKFFIEQDGAALFSNSLLVACHDSGSGAF